MGRPVSSCLWIVSLSGAFIDDDDGYGAPGPFLPSFLRFPPSVPRFVVPPLSCVKSRAQPAARTSEDILGEVEPGSGR